MLLPHNQETYNKIVKLLDSGINNFCLVQGMGTGKSYIFFELAKLFFWNKKILFIQPQRSIEKNIKKYDEFRYIEHHVDFMTNQSFKDDQAILQAYDNYDVIFVDECHHMGSLLYGKNKQTLLSLVKDDKNKYFIGMTATPIRDSDKVDVSSFFDCVVKGKSTIECIQEGLMPQVQYLMLFPDISISKLKEYNIQPDYYKSEKMLKDIINTNDDINRWLVYYGTINQLKEHRDLMKNLFPDFRIIEITSDIEHSQNSIDDIKDDEKVIICSVDKLLEGIHLPNMFGVLLFRKVHSLTVFTQIFGRITAIGQTKNPLFVDCTGTGTRLLNKLEGYAPNTEGTLTKKITNRRPILYTELKNKRFFDIQTLLIASENYETKMINLIIDYVKKGHDINNITQKTKYKGENIGNFLYRARKQLDNAYFERRKYEKK